ncbi:hypothetical protein V1264_010223 [Littorina saxatilis]|uniref:NADH dehydrogenase [ubiquinone] 1 alpha subcomplex subunit 1 n=1 Tax=Littorina saxatilis TaxID=31220 RepID=A0AAN9G1E4_9CAEN
MWYEILPSAGLVFTFLALPSGCNWVLNKVFHNRKHCARDWNAAHFEDYDMYRRDWRITGSEYKPKGLESIPDPPSK